MNCHEEEIVSSEYGLKATDLGDMERLSLPRER